MTKFTVAIWKFFVANMAIVFTFILLPAFLITDDIAMFDAIMKYLFNDQE